jgi:hypothetical protein
MVNPVGSLEIIGTIDVANIKAGLSQVKQGLENAKESAKSAFGDMEGLGKVLGGIGTSLIGIGAAAGTAIIGLAAMGPAVAPAMARMQVSMFELSKTLGEALAPAFENFANIMEDFVGWLNTPEGQGVLEVVNDTFLKLQGTLTNVFYWLDKIKPAADLAVGALGGVLDVVFPSSGGDKKGVNDFVKQDIKQETPSNILSGGILGGILGSGAGLVTGMGATALAVPGMVMGGLSMLINSIVEPINKSIMTGYVQNDEIREAAYQAYRDRGQDTAILDSVYGKMREYSYVGDMARQDTNKNFSQGYPSEKSWWKEEYDSNYFINRNGGT